MNNADWISVNTRLPELFEVVWIYWRDREVLLGFRCDDQHNIENDPESGWYSIEDEKSKWCKWWMPVRCSPFDKPLAPHAPPTKMSEKGIVFHRYSPLKAYGERVIINTSDRKEE